MKPIVLSESDLRQHDVTIGTDVFPMVTFADERTRLNMFAEKAIEKLPLLYEQLISGANEFKILKTFGSSPGEKSKRETLVITNRGPVFSFPVLLQNPSGQTLLDQPNYRTDFEAVSSLFFSMLTGKTIMRIGLIRNLFFFTSKTSHMEAFIHQAEFAGATLQASGCHATFADGQFNVQIKINPKRVIEASKMPVGATVKKPLGYGVHVQVDVNNRVPRPLETADITEILDKADGIWPDDLLRFLAGG